MTEPIVFISRNRIKEGKTDEFRKHYRDSIPPIFDGKSMGILALTVLAVAAVAS